MMAQGNGRSLNVWFRDEIQNALVAVDMANLDLVSSLHSPDIQIYRKGYSAAIHAVAAAFGISYEPVQFPARETQVIDSPGWTRVIS